MVTIVVGGQYGSEAKAKAAIHHTLMTKNADSHMGIRCGGPNAGHTVFLGENKTKYVLRHVPSLVAVPGAKLVICAGSLLNMNLLLKEVEDIENLGVDVKNRLVVDQNAVVVTPELIEEERRRQLGDAVGSTCTGTGTTAAARCVRDAHPVGDYRGIMETVGIRVVDTFDIIHDAIDECMINVVVEGTQGFALSALHSGYYPFSTSKDTTASAFASEAGIAPADVSSVIMVIRSFPIRVGGNSGPLPMEKSWNFVKGYCGAPAEVDLMEMTSVTKKVRRVGSFDVEAVKKAIRANSPDEMALHGADYICWEDRNKTDGDSLSKHTLSFIDDLEDATNVPVTMVFTGPGQEHVINRLG